MSKILFSTIFLTAIIIFTSIGESYAFDPQDINVSISTIKTQQFSGYDIITIDFNLINNGLNDATFSGNSMIFLNDTNYDYWEPINYLDFGFTSVECPSLDVIVSGNSSADVKLCFLTTDDQDVGYSLVVDENNYFSENMPNEFVLESVPSWFSVTAGAWCSSDISDSDYINSLQYNIQQGNIDVLRTQSSSDLGFPIPSWVKSNACDWSSGFISDYKFLDSVYWLIDNGKITLN